MRIGLVWKKRKHSCDGSLLEGEPQMKREKSEDKIGRSSEVNVQ